MTTSTQRIRIPEGRTRAERPPTDRLLRVTPFAVRSRATGGDRADGEEDDGLTLDGFAAVFNRETLIDSWEGRFWEQAAPGSMKKTFREQNPRLQFDHGTHPMIGSMPIGAIRSIGEDADEVLAPDGGAHVVARLFDNWLIEPVRDAIREQAINGMSFRFGVVREEWRNADGKLLRDPQEIFEELERTWFSKVPDDELLHRTLREVKVPELGPVVWPAYGDTSVSVRSRSVTIDLAAAREGSPAERRKIADLLFEVDNPRERTSGVPMLDGTDTAVPDLTPESSGAETHTGAEPSDPPASTVEGSQPPAARHASPPSSPRERSDVQIALDMVRSSLLSLPDEDPTA
jgi:phage head maturation protease